VWPVAHHPAIQRRFRQSASPCRELVEDAWRIGTALAFAAGRAQLATCRNEQCGRAGVESVRSAKALGIVPLKISSAPVHHRAPSAEELPAIREGAWAVWALKQSSATSIPSSSFECRLPDGRTGVVAAMFDRGEWRLVCRAS